MTRDFDEFLAEYERPRTVEVALPPGRSGLVAVFRFELPSSYSAVRQLARDAQSFANLCRPSSCHPDWEPYLPADQQVAVEIGYLARLCTGYRLSDSDEWLTMSELDWLKFAQACGVEVGILFAGLSEMLAGHVAEREEQKLVALGEHSGNTRSTERISSSGETI